MAFKIYTKTGDAGITGLFGGKRLPKSHLRIESYGMVDELNSHIGLVRDLTEAPQQKLLLKEIQDKLFSIGAYLAADPDKKAFSPDILPLDIEMLENEIDLIEAELPVLKNFVLPGGHPTVSHCHIARCVCRKAERAVVALDIEEKIDPIVISYLNRLSDFLFVFSRKLAKDLSAEEIIWKGTASR